jgi:L-lysine exporter family protein LysE/ArgO
MAHSYIFGLTTGAALIIAIGAQNAFILTQGIKKKYYIFIPLICFLIDAVLITAGVAGFGALFRDNRILNVAASLFGAAFLFWYGTESLKSVFKDNTLNKSLFTIDTRKKALIATLSISLLNPHLYLDTVILLGSIGSSFGGSKTGFLAGAVTASFLWFFSLSLGGKVLSPLFSKPLSWKILNSIVTVSMWTISFSLVKYAGIF